MLRFAQEVLDVFRENTITELELSVNQSSQRFEFNTKGSIVRMFSSAMPIEWDYNQNPNFIDNQRYAKCPIFSESSFNDLKDVLLLNTSLVMWSTNSSILSKEQCDYLNKIIHRNVSLSKMTNDITLFHYSAMCGDIDVVQIYSWRAKEASELEVKCQSGKTPLDYAREKNHLSIVSFLENQVKKLRDIQTKVTEFSTTQINKPLSDDNKQHIFDSLRIFSKFKPNSLTQNLIDAALDNIYFPPAFKAKLLPLQLAYQEHKTSAARKSLLASTIQIYFEEEGVSLFKELLSGVLVPEDWNHSFMRRLAGDEIIIIENAYVEATIQDGKIYWCINFGNQIYYRKPFFETIISQAKIQNRSWHLTWKEFRTFKDAGKRTGTVSITEERFVEAMSPFVTNNISTQIWQELRNVGVLDRKLRLSQAWYPFSNQNIIISAINQIDNQKKGPNLYQTVSDILQQITNNNAFQEIIAQDMVIFRAALVSKTWYKTGLIKNNKKDSHITKIWDVGVARELRDHHAVSHKPPCEIEHIPAKSQIMCKEDSDYWNIQFNYCDEKITGLKYVLSQNNAHNLRSASQYPNDLQSSLDYWILQKQKLENARTQNSSGLSFWGIYLQRKDHKAGNTNGASKTEQKDLDFYSSIHTYIHKFKEELEPNMFLQALGAFRYMYARMCKTHNNIANQDFISKTPNTLFDHRQKQQIDDLFIKEMQSFANSRLGFR